MRVRAVGFLVMGFLFVILTAIPTLGEDEWTKADLYQRKDKIQKIISDLEKAMDDAQNDLTDTQTDLKKVKEGETVEGETLESLQSEERKAKRKLKAAEERLVESKRLLQRTEEAIRDVSSPGGSLARLQECRAKLDQIRVQVAQERTGVAENVIKTIEKILAPETVGKKSTPYSPLESLRGF